MTARRGEVSSVTARTVVALVVGCATAAGASGCDGDRGRAASAASRGPETAVAGGGWSGARPRGPDPAAAGDSALERMAEAAVPRVEAAAGLEFARPPRLARADRDRLEAFLASELDERLPPARAEATTEAYARLGLLPDTLDLRALLRSVYLSQVVGYYVPEADTLFVREGVGSGMLEPVLVHELVHALQDQHMDLDSLMEARRESNDAAAAARAALEGHATYVMLEDLLRRRTGGELDAGSLDLGRLLGSVDLSSLGGTPALSGAPRLVRESLIFPYTGGLAFVQAWWREREGRPAPLGEQMPASTEQILHPERFAGADRDAPTGVRFPSGPAPPWREVHAGSLGEFEIRLLLSTFLADSVRARAAAAGWDGDRYRLLASPEGGEVLTWATVWDGPAEAAEFAAAVEAALRSRYGDSVRSPEDARAAGDGAAGRTVRVRRRRAGGRPLVVVTDAPADRRGELPRWATGVELEEAGGR